MDSTKLSKVSPGTWVIPPLLLFACTLRSGASQQNVLDIVEQGQVADVKLVLHQEEADAGKAEYCKDFSLDARQIKQFFILADVISPEEKQLDYYWAPCRLTGKFLVGSDESVEFEINAASTGVIYFAQDSEVHFGCKEKCKHLFDYGFY